MKTKQPFHLGLFMAAIFWSLLTPAYAQVSGAFQEQAGQVVIEAEQGYTRADLSAIDSSLHRWIARSGTADTGADIFVRAEPDSDAVFAGGYTPGAPELRYQVQFATPGTYFVWLRIYAADNDSDAAHVGIDGSAPASASGIATTVRNNWAWTNATLKNQPATITVPSAGLHTINLWAGKDGVRIDRLLLTANSSYVPSGVGPEESQPSDVVPAVRSNGAPTGVQPFGTTNVTLSLATDENATCRHATVTDTDFDAMTGMFSTTGTTSHATQIGSLSDGQSHALYVRCRDSAGNVNQEDYPIAFSIAAPPKHALSVAVSGQGTVSSSPAGISCGSDCGESYDTGEAVTLTAAPASGTAFSEWSGACSGTSASCSITMDAAKSVTATFVALEKPTLTTPSGVINTQTPTYQWSPVAGATHYRLLVRDAAYATKINTVYTSDAAGCASMTQSCSITPAVALADGDTTWQIQATVSGSGPWGATMKFNVAASGAGTQYTLSTTVSGSGSITSNPAGINCGSDCSESYASATVVTLSAVPASGYTFAGWSGEGCSGTSTCTVNMLAARSVTASFTVLSSSNDTVSPQPVASGTVPLTLSAPQTAKSIPIRSGIPFPYGAVPSIAHLRLENGSALEIPAQFNALASWPDGSVKSALVQFVGDVSATPAGYQLAYGNQVGRSTVTQAIGVTAGQSEVMVDTGLLQLTLSSQTGLVTSVTRDANRNGVYESSERNVDGSELYLVNAFNSQEYTASRATDAMVTVEENGPVRTVIKATGSMTNAAGERLIKYLVRYYAYRDSDKLDVDYTLVDDRLEENVRAVRSTLALSLSSYGLRLNYVNDGQTQYRFGGENGAVYSGAVASEHYLYQNGEFNFKTVEGMSKSQSYSGVGSGSRTPGWVALDSGSRHLALMVRDFWQQYPNELNINGNVLTVALHPARASGATPETTPVTQADGEYKRPKTFYFEREGGAKTYQMRLAFGDVTPTNAEASQGNQVFQSHLPALAATPAWYTSSGVFGDLSVGTSTSAATGYDAYLTRGNLEPSLNKAENNNLTTLYGWRDFGDRLRTGWANVINGVKIPSFYNDTHVGANNFFRMYLRTGDTRWYSLAETSTRHAMDLDVSHGPRKGYWTTGGIQQPAGELHGLGHANVDHQVRNLHWGHAHISGLSDYYLLTGDKRAYDVILEIGNWWKFVTPHFYKLPFKFDDTYREAERDFGWPLYVMNEYVRVTGDTQYHKDVAGHLVNYLIGWWQTPADHIGYDPLTQSLSNDVIGINDASKGTGFWTMTRAGNYGQYNKSTGTTPWMAGSLMSNIILFYEQDKRLNAVSQAAGISHATLKDMLFQNMNYVMKHGYDASQVVEKRIVYAETVRYAGGGNHVAYPLAYLNRLYNADLAAGKIARPEWYDTSSSWGGIAQEMYAYYTGIKALQQTFSDGFYGYEIIYPMDFFKIMGQ